MSGKLTSFRKIKTLSDFLEFLNFLKWYVRSRFYNWFAKFEVFKDILVDFLYQKRGKYVRPFLHFGTIGLVFLVISVGPVLFKSDDERQNELAQGVLSTQAYGADFYTQQAQEVKQFRGGEITTHVVGDGETLSSIAERYGINVGTILWENDLDEKATLKPGTELSILPINGVRHKVARGETIYSIGKKYGLDSSQAQIIVDYPFNEFLNDETFELVTGQYIMVPDGVPPKKPNPTSTTSIASQPIRMTQTPDAGVVTATGSFAWPASGIITQGYSFYHKAWDIANRAGGPILASDSGTVIGAGWLDGYGYGNRIMVDHGNGYITLYAHLSVVQVTTGQRVNRGDVIGQMGSTGRSTGTHLHFEIRSGGVILNPGQFLQ